MANSDGWAVSQAIAATLCRVRHLVLNIGVKRIGFGDTVREDRIEILHQAIVGGNIGFAFSGVNNQGFNFVAAAA